MGITSCRHRLGAAVAACALAWSGTARADAADAFNFTVGQSFLRDDNLFRLADAADAAALIGSSERGDTVSTTSAGVQFDKQVGRQRLFAGVNATIMRYERFRHLDFDGKDLRAGWGWQLGSRWRGELSWSRSEALSGFGDFQTPEKNVNTNETTSLGANYGFHPDWSVGARAFRSVSENTSAQRASSQYETNGAEASLQLATGSGNSAALRARRTEGGYPTPQSSGGRLISNSYSQEELEGSVGWRFGGASRLEALLARVRRSHDEVPGRDFTGAAGRIAWDWMMTGKTALNVTARREIGAMDDILASYVVTRAFSIAPRWLPTAKTSLKAGYEWRTRDYQGDPVPLLSGIEKREDRLRIASVSASYAPATSLVFSLTLRRERRESNYSGFQYRDSTAFASAQFSF